MDWLIADIETNGPATTEEQARQRPVPQFEGEAAGSDTHSNVLTSALHVLGIHSEQIREFAAGHRSR